MEDRGVPLAAPVVWFIWTLVSVQAFTVAFIWEISCAPHADSAPEIASADARVFVSVVRVLLVGGLHLWSAVSALEAIDNLYAEPGQAESDSKLVFGEVP